MARLKLRSNIRTYHWLLLTIYLFPLGYLLYCLIAPSDIAKDNLQGSFVNNGTVDHTCDVSGLNKWDSKSICRYITHNCDLELFEISKIFFCDGGENKSIKVGLGISILIEIIVIFMVFGLITSNFLYPNLDLLSKHMQISDRISGLTLLSLGNATPDIFSTYNAFKTDSSSLAIGELLGSANFVICFVIGCMGILKPFRVNHFEFIKDLYFFLVLILISLYFIQDEKLMTFECVLMVALYLLYVNYSIFFTNEGKDVEELLPPEPEDEEVIPVSNHLSPQQEAVDAAESIKSSLDDNKAKGLQKLSFYDAMKLWRAKSPLFKSSSPSLSDPQIAPRVKSSQNIRDLETPNFLGGKSSSTEAVRTKRSESVPLIQTVLHQPSPLQQPPSIIFEDDEGQNYEGNQMIDNILPSEEKKDSVWIFLLSPLFDDSDAKNSPLTVLTFPLLFLLNILIPVYSKELEVDSFKHKNLINFKKTLFIIQLCILPVFFHYLLFFKYPIIIMPLSILILLALHLILRNSQNYTIPIVGFASSILLIITTSSYLITILKNIGVIFRISESLLGLTILALGNSMGDLISNLTLAELDLSVIGINACFGSPLLYILVGIGINGIVVNIQDRAQYMALKIDTNFKMSSFGLVMMLVFYAIVIPLNGWYIDRKIGLVGVLWWGIITGINVYLETGGR